MTFADDETHIYINDNAAVKLTEIIYEREKMFIENGINLDTVATTAAVLDTYRKVFNELAVFHKEKMEEHS